MASTATLKFNRIAAPVPEAPRDARPSQVRHEAAAARRRQDSHRRNSITMAAQSSSDPLRARTACLKFVKASEEEFAQVAVRLLAAERELGAKKLFKSMDTDGSGMLDWDEFDSFVRDKLRLDVAALQPHRLQAVWLVFNIDEQGRAHRPPSCTIPLTHDPTQHALALLLLITGWSPWPSS